jgi:hypothetical protein
VFYAAETQFYDLHPPRIPFLILRLPLPCFQFFITVAVLAGREQLFYLPRRGRQYRCPFKQGFLSNNR